MKLVLDNILKTKLDFYSIVFKCLFVIFLYQLGYLLNKLNLNSQLGIIIYKNYKLYFILGCISSSVILLTVVRSWFERWTVISRNNINYINYELKILGSRKYTFLLISVIIVLFLSINLLLVFSKIIYLGIGSINGPYVNNLITTYKVFCSHSIIPFISLIVFLIVSKSSLYLFYINTIIFLPLISFSLIEIDSIYSLAETLGYLSVADIYNIIYTNYIITTFLCALLNYLISENRFSDVNCSMPNINQLFHLFSLIYIFASYLLFIKAFSFQ